MARPARYVGWLAGLLLVTVACTQPSGGSTATPVATPPHARDVPLVRLADGSWHAEQVEELPLSRVVRVVDGDTLLVAGPDGQPLRVRLFGIEAPEAGEPCGAEATAHLERTVGERVRLLADERATDRFRRELRYVFTSDGMSVDAELIRHGSGRAWREDGAYRDVLVALEAAARLEGRGCLWAR